MSGKSWYATGYDGIDKEKERIARQHGPNRFWMKEQTTREVVFVDDEPITIYEHNPQMNGSFRNWLTCLKDSNDIVPCCEKLGEKTRYFVGYYTAVDLTEHKDAKGNSYQYEVKLFPAKLKTLGVLRRKKNDKGSIIGGMFKVYRDTVDDPNCGGEFEFQREADMEKLFKVANYKGKKLSDLYKEAQEKPEVMARLKDTFQLVINDKGIIEPRIFPFNYYALLAPKDPKEVRQIVGGATVGDSSRSNGSGPKGSEGGGANDGPSDDEIPF